ncbi:MAG: DUF1080 domain-containing protein [Planctomycetaceae bacterium]|nr:DUF1080 domain-containing protein [Planctomycetaceae bacterium]
MKYILILTTAVFWLTGSMFGTGGFSGNVLFADEPGYTDTPFLPDSKWRVHDQTRPQPPKVVPGTGDLGSTPPSDAVLLFDGTSLKHWKPAKKGTAGDDKIADGVLDILQTGTLQTKAEFGDYQLHLEWRSPPEEAGKSDRMTWGNSGIFLMGLFEIQIIESHDSYIYADGNAGAVYGQYPPLVNPARKPGEWQSFDIFFTAPKWADGKQTQPAHVTTLYNGVLVQNNVPILGMTKHKALPGKYPVNKSTGPVLLQEHHSAVKFRNIWIRPLETPPAAAH